MKTLTLFFLLLFAVSARAQNTYVADSTNYLTVPDTVTVGTAKIGFTVPVVAAYFHHASNIGTLVFKGLDINAIANIRAVSIPTVANGAYVGICDSTLAGTIPLVASTGDTITAPSLYTRWHVGGSEVALTFWGTASGTYFGTAFQKGVAMAFLKQ